METSLAVGNRVSTATGNGFVRFIGSTAFAAGKWVGVELDTPTGKHNGAVQGKSYFTCKPGHGVFVRPAAAKIIDVPSRRSIDESIRGERKVPLTLVIVEGDSDLMVGFVSADFAEVTVADGEWSKIYFYWFES